MSVDDIVKLLLAGSFSFAVIGISYALMRLIQKGTEVVEDVRKPIQNVGELSDLALEDYKNIRGIIGTITKIANRVNGYLEDPMKLIKNSFGMLNRNRDNEL